jgi:hypothetical protein
MLCHEDLFFLLADSLVILGNIADLFLKICINLLCLDDLPTHWCYKLVFCSNVQFGLLEVKKET